MPQPHPAKAAKSRNILRSHSGCIPCRRRGKKCDETKSRCRACTRLSLDCSYGVAFTFRNLDKASFLQQNVAKIASPRFARSTTHSDPLSLGIPPTPDFALDLEATYFSHFQKHVHRLLPSSSSLKFTDGSLQCPALRFAVLCISASNLSMLNTLVQTRILPNDTRLSVFSPLVNYLHHSQAQRYHDQARLYCRAVAASETQHQAPTILTAYTLLAYYHHASTNHSQFRLAVWESVQFVLQTKERMLGSTAGAESLQMWYRLCMSHRLAKPPALLLEGEGASSFGPNRFPDAFDHIYMNCILGLSADDLVYDILIKTMEIRTRLVVFRCVAGYVNIPEQSDQIGSVVHEVLNKMLGRDNIPDECAEARAGYVRRSHLLELLNIQKERLKVWKSRIRDDQRPGRAFSDTTLQRELASTASLPSMRVLFPTHRDAMNALYHILCEIMFEEVHGDPTSNVPPTSTMGDLAHYMCQIIIGMDFKMSNTSDVYTFSLAETLLQLVLLWRSDTIFHHILDVAWPQLETQGRGYEHSHYPTHLAKRIITQIAVYWSQNRAVNFAFPAVTENIPKLKLLDIQYPMDLVVGGHDNSGQPFIERIPLP